MRRILWKKRKSRQAVNKEITRKESDDFHFGRELRDASLSRYILDSYNVKSYQEKPIHKSSIENAIKINGSNVK